MITIILLYVLCALSFSLCKLGLLYAEPFFFVGTRMLIGGLLIGCYQYLSAPKSLVINIRTDWWLFLKITLFHIYGAYGFELWSMQYISSVHTAFLYNLSPFVAAFFSYMLFNEHLSRLKIAGLLIGVVGFLPQLYALIGSHTTHILSLCGILASIVCTMYGWALVQQALKERNYSPLIINAYTMIGGGLLSLVTSGFTESWNPYPVNDWPYFLLVTMALVVLMNIIFYNAYAYLLGYYSSTFLSFAGFITPFISSLFGFIFLSEQVGWSFLVSLIIVSIGLYIFYKQELYQSIKPSLSYEN